MRRATRPRALKSRRIVISIHALLAESDGLDYDPIVHIEISIHALLAESDSASLWLDWLFPEFLSTLSLRRATPPSAMSSSGKEYFYPRSPCGERQAPPCYNLMIHQNFYPRSPCGERLNLTFHQRGCIIFLFTLSLRRATPPSITPTASRRYFYPRSPCGERLH